jgi:selenocysteine lyase/cysteine desulfurase
MKLSEQAKRKNYKEQDSKDGSSLTRRNFLKMCGAAVGGGALLSTKPALGNSTTRNVLAQGSFLSNPTEDYWRTVREQFCLRGDIIHMNTGTVGNISIPVRDKLFEHIQTLAEDPYPTGFYYPYHLNDSSAGAGDGVRSKAAAFMGADFDEIIITGCTTEGMTFVACGLDLGPGDEVLTTMHEHSGGLDCWKILRDRRGITLTQLPFQCAYENTNEIVNLFANAITPQTKVMSFCHINYTSGIKMPVKELCQLAANNNIISVIDGAHAIGMLDLDMHDIGCDFYACSPQKWLCAPWGVGVLYCKLDKQDLICPTITEAYGSLFRVQLEFRGQRSIPILVCLQDAMDFQDTIGKTNIENRVLSLSAYCKARLAAIPGVHLLSSTHREQSTGLTAFYAKDKYDRQYQSNLMNKISADYNIRMRTVDIRDTEGGPLYKAIRASTHIYNNYDQIDLLARAVEENLGI